MVKPKEIDGRGDAFIETGYGMEGVLPDAIAERIYLNEMVPRFKKKDYYGGIDAAVTTIMEISAGEYSADDYGKKEAWKKILPFIFMLIIFILIFVFKAGQARRYAHTNGMTFWAAWALMNAASYRVLNISTIRRKFLSTLQNEPLIE